LQKKYPLHTPFLRIILFVLALLVLLQLSFIPLWAQETETTAEPASTLPEGPAEGEGSSSEAPGEAAPTEAPDYEYEDPEFNDNRVSYPLMILRTIAVMGVIIIGVYFLFRFLIKNKRKLITDSEVIKVLATYPLAANRIIQVVDVGGQVLVLGVSDSSINLITELQDQEVIDRIRLASSKEKSGTGSFKDTFIGLLGGKAFMKPGQISQLSGYRKRINRMRKF
jgi:flagellar biosynthetic protein FliO